MALRAMYILASCAISMPTERGRILKCHRHSPPCVVEDSLLYEQNMEFQHLNEKKRRFLQLPEYTHATRTHPLSPFRRNAFEITLTHKHPFLYKTSDL
jgi:hypothetical protein